MELATPNLIIKGSYREIIQRILPVLLAFFIPQVNFFINSVFIARLDNDTRHSFYLAAAGIVSIYYLVFSVIGIGLSNGVQILIAREAGQNNHARIKIIFENACLWAVVLALFFVLLSFLTVPWLLPKILQADLAEKSIAFIQVRMLGLPFLYLYLLRNALYINYNRINALIWFSIVETVVNIILDYVLIFGNFGAPIILGFIGAAYASIITEIVGLIWVILMLYFDPLHPKYKLTYIFKYDKQSSLDLVHIAIPTILQMGLSIISWQVFFFLIAQRGNSFLAASNVLRIIFTMVNIFVWTTGSVTNAMIGNLYGQKCLQESASLIKKLLQVGFIGTIIFSILAYALRPLILMLFQQDEVILGLVQNPYLIILIAFNISIATHIFFNALLATRSGPLVIIIELLTIIIYCIYAYIVCNYLELSLTWVWSSEIVYSLLLGLISGYYFWIYCQNYKHHA